MIREKDNEQKASYTEFEKGRDDEAKKKKERKVERTSLELIHSSFLQSFILSNVYFSLS